MLDVTLPDGFPTDLARICQSGAKVYLPKLKEFGTVTKFMDAVDIRLDQGKSSSTTSYSRDEFLQLLVNDEIVAKSRVILPEDENKPMRIKPRAKVAPIPAAPPAPASLSAAQISPAKAPIEESLLTGYINESTGKFSKTLQPGMIEIKYKKVTKKLELELDSVQLQKLKELGIIE